LQRRCNIHVAPVYGIFHDSRNPLGRARLCPSLNQGL
jgi:hypothetical protein